MHSFTYLSNTEAEILAASSSARPLTLLLLLLLRNWAV